MFSKTAAFKGENSKKKLVKESKSKSKTKSALKSKLRENEVDKVKGIQNYIKKHSLISKEFTNIG